MRFAYSSPNNFIGQNMKRVGILIKIKIYTLIEHEQENIIPKEKTRFKLPNTRNTA